MNQKLLGFFLTLLISMNSTSSSCVEGCLACGLDTTGNPICEICDVHNSYKLLPSGKCIKWGTENCEIPSVDPNEQACNLCMPGFALDNQGNRCSPVPQKFLIPDCKRYHWEYSCVECMEEFYLSQKKCKPISTQVQNCSIYVDAKTCLECKDGYFLNIGTGECNQITKKNECLVYSSVECTECSSGHFQVDSLTSRASLSNQFVQSLTKYSHSETPTSAFFETKSVNNCVLGTVEHCLKHLSYDSCSECALGYFLSPSKKCVSEPIRTVAHCQAYQNANECIRCNSGFYLEQNVCRELTSVTGCLEFDPVTEDCVKCDQEKYYLDEGFCGKRNKSENISFCQKTSETDDHCVTCLPSFQLTDDKLKCLPHIPHCQSYVSSTDITDQDYTNENTISLKCDSCANHFYLLPNKLECVPQDSVGCITFTTNTNLCTGCASGYYLTDDACTLYTKDFCKTYAPTADECASCFDGFFLLSGECKFYTAKNCLTYASAEDNCETCPVHYYLKTDGVTSQKNCLAFTAKNCKTYTGAPASPLDTCSECFQGYVLTSGNCIPISLLNCAIQTPGANSCATCKQGYFLSGTTCMAYTARNCATFNPSANECATCLGVVTPALKTRTFYKTADNKCLPYTVMNCQTKVDDEDKCATCVNATDWFVNAQGECIPSHLNHCQALASNTTTDECATCLNGFKLVNGKCFKVNLPGCITYSAENCASCAPGFYLSSSKCHPYSVSNCATYETTMDKCLTCITGFELISNFCELKQVTNCAVYDSSRACTKCQIGYYFNSPNCVIQSISGCAKYVENVNQCKECRIGFTAPDNTTCNASTPLKGCMRLDPSDSSKCMTCYRGYNLDGATQLCSIATLIANCIQYELNTGKCEVCSLGNQPDADNSACEAITTQANLNSNCRSMDLDTGNCKDCLLGFYLASENNCVAQNVSNCITYKHNENKCLQCKDGVNKVGDYCVEPATISNCLHYSPDKTSCLICKDNYFPLNNGCTKNTLANCKVKKLNEKKCEFCKDDFVLGDKEDCGGNIVSPTDVQCLTYNPSTNTCDMCKKGFQLVGGVCTSFTIATSDFQLDASCMGTDDTGPVCDFCPQGNESLSLAIVKMDDADYTGCAKIDLTSGNCTQCLPGYDVPAGAAGKVCTKYSGSARKCLQLMASAAAGSTLDEATKCASCFDTKTFYLSTNTCTASSSFNNVQEVSLTADTAKYCKDKSAFRTATATYTQCLEVNNKTAAQVNTIADCEVWDEDTNTCKYCKHGYELTIGGTAGPSDDTCTVTNTIKLALHIRENSSVLEVTDFVDITDDADVQAMEQINHTGSDQLKPIMCTSPKVRSLKNTGTIYHVNYPPTANYLTGNDLDSYIENKIEFTGKYQEFSCIDLPTTFWSNDTTAPKITTANEKNKCSGWYSNESSVLCRGCVDNYYAKWVVPSQVIASGTPTATTPSDDYSKLMVRDCMTLENANEIYPDVGILNLRRKYQGLDIQTTGTQPTNIWLNFDSCEGNNFLLLFGEIKTNTLVPGVFDFSPGGTQTSYFPPITCMPEAGFTNNLFDHAIALTTTNDSNGDPAFKSITKGVQNCQINYYIASGLDTNPIINNLIASGDANGSRIGCIACRPGFSGVTNAANDDVNTIASITSCTAISNCDDQKPQNWMNACENCADNYGWEVSDTYVVLFHMCATGDANCLMFLNDGSGTYSCIVCKEGYLLTSEGVCVNVLENCDTIGLTNSALQFHATVKEPNFLIFNFMVRKLLGGPQPQFCKTCSGTSGLAFMAIPSGDECTFDFSYLLNTSTDNATAATNCRVFGTTKNICVRCNTGYYLDENASDVCVAHTTDGSTLSHAGCESSSDGSACSACIQGYNSIDTATSDFLCFTDEEIHTKLNCDKLDITNKKCLICSVGFVFDSTTEYICKGRTTETCNQETSDGSCLQCAEPNHFPINFKIPGSPDEYSYVCAPQYNSDAKKLYANQVVYDLTNNGVSVVESNIPNRGFYQKFTVKADYETASSKGYKDRCLNVRGGLIRNCSDNSTNGLKCAACAPNFSLQGTTTTQKRCVPNIKNCLRFLPNSQECEMCEGKYKKDPSSGLCIDRATPASTEFIPDPLCLGNNNTALECDECANGNKSIERIYLNTTANTGCLESNISNGFCTLCEPGYSFDDDSPTCTAVSSATACYMLETGLSGSSVTLAATNCLHCNSGNILHSDDTCKAIPDLINSTDLIFATTVKDNTCEKNIHKIASATTENRYECASMTHDMSSPVANCLAYKINGECALCAAGKSGVNCEDVVNPLNIIVHFNTDLEISNNTTASTVQVTEKDILNQQISSTIISPVQCNNLFPMKKIKYDFNPATATAASYANKSSSKPQKNSASNTVFTNTLVPFASYPEIECYSRGSETLFLAQSTVSPINTTAQRDQTPADTDCAYWWTSEIEHPASTKLNAHKCMRCMDGYIPEVKQVTHFSKGFLGSETFQAYTPDAKDDQAMITECVLATSLFSNAQKAYEGLGYHSKDAFPWGSIISVDHCNAADEILVVFVDTDSATGARPTLTYVNYDFASVTKKTNHICASFDASNPTDFFATNPFADKNSTTINNCQINISEVVTSATVVTTISTTFKCAACSPGYRPFTNAKDSLDISNTGNYINQCIQIDNCASDGLAWMNACSKCDTGHAWFWDDYSAPSDVKLQNAKTIQFHNCVATPLTNCLVVNDNDDSTTSNDKCVLCKPGFVLTHTGKCESATYMQKKNCADNQTSVKGYKYNALSFTDSKPQSFAVLFYMQFLLENNSISHIPSCVACDSGFHLVNVPVASDAICSNDVYYTDWTSTQTPATGCETWDKTDLTNCATCPTNQVVVAGNYTSQVGTTCADITARKSVDPFIENCQVMDGATNYHCTKCKPWFKEKAMGTGPTSYKICYNFTDYFTGALNCAKFDFSTQECTICDQGYEFDTDNPLWCKPSTTLTDSDCNQKTKDDFCLSCHGEYYYPFHFKQETPANTYQIKCIDQGRNLSDEFFMIPKIFDLTTDKYSVKNDQIPYKFHFRTDDTWANHTPLTPANLPEGIKNVKHICVNLIHDPDCIEAKDHGYKCSKCISTKGLFPQDKAYNVCSADCGTVNPHTGLCVKCVDANKYLNSERNVCANYSFTSLANCSIKSPFLNGCLYCKSGFFLTSAQECSPYTPVSNCMTRDMYSNKCVKCDDGFSLDTHGNCLLNSLSNCIFADSTEFGSCLACDAGYELIDKKCVYIDAMSMLCKSRDSDGNCASCFNGYTLSNGLCKVSQPVNEIEGCINYDHHNYLCVECDFHLTLTNGFCKGKEIENCKALSEDQGHCLVCDDQFYLKGYSCVPRLNLNCLVEAPDQDRCLSCHDHSYLKGNKCIPYTAQKCKTFSRVKDQCITCQEGFYLDPLALVCVHTSTFFCQTKNHLKNECFSCTDGYFLDNDGLCLPRTELHCSMYDPFADSCLECEESHYLYTNGTTAGPNTTSKGICKPYTISNCQNYNPIDNKCLSCMTGFYLSPSQGCLAKTAFNCSAWNSTLTQCISCPSGTYLELGICNPYSVSNCASYHEAKNECLSCPEGFFLQQSECLSHTVSDCENFKANKDECQKCMSGFYLRNGTCQAISQNNCFSHSDDKNECTSCETGYFLQNGVCLTYTISCMDYSPSSNECLSCPKGQYLEDKNFTCINYTVENCASYSFDSNKCETCVPNYYYKNGLCLPYTVTNCKVYHALFDECVTCKDKFYHHKQMCLAYNVINCATYSPVSDVCLTCMEGHYNKNGNCLPYTAKNCGTFFPNIDYCQSCESKLFYQLTVLGDLFQCKDVTPVENCDVYYTYEDKCKTCDNDFYLVESTNTCHEVPETVSNCQEFIDAANCKVCISPYFLDNNECVRSDHIIDKCVQYESNTKCLKCEGANILSTDATLCLKTTESSCETYLDPANCKTCAGNNVINYIDDSSGEIVSGLNGEDLSSLRAICNDSGIDNCAIARSAFPENTCLQCNTNYFLASSSSCQIVNQFIDNCEIYFADGICSQCENNHVLSTDKTKCNFDVTFLGSNCQSGKFFSEPKCFMCKSGFYFSDKGDCLACAMEGCAVCSEDASASCRLCKKDFYMNSEMKCISNGSVSRLEKEVADNGLLSSGFLKESGFTIKIMNFLAIPAVVLLFVQRMF